METKSPERNTKNSGGGAWSDIVARLSGIRRSYLRMALAILLVGVLGLIRLATMRGSEEVPVSSAIERKLTLNIVHGPEVRAYLSSIREGFFENFNKLSDGTEVTIELVNEFGYAAAEALASGEIKAAAWLAPSSSLVNLANSKVRGLGAKQLECEPLFATPVVFAVRPSDVVAFGAKGQAFSWQDFYDSKIASVDPNAAQRRHVAYSHADPQSSVTGLEALTQLGFLAARNKDGLSLADLTAPAAWERLERIEDLASGYSFSEAYLLSRVAKAAGKQLRFAVTTEQQLALYNLQRGEHDEPLMALYAKEGTYWQDYHFCVSAADWVTPAHRAALRQLSSFLRGTAAQRLAKERGFRSVVVELPDVAPLTSQYGVALSEPQKSVRAVSGAVIDRLITAWPELKRPNAIALVLDTSGSMEGEALRHGREQFRNLLARLPARDLRALVTFASQVTVVSPFTNQSDTIIPLLDKTMPIGGSAVYDGIHKAIELMTAPELNSYRKTILVYTDGEDKNSEGSLQSLLDYVNSKFSQYDINLLVIGVGREGVNYDDLTRVTRVANGLFREAPSGKIPIAFFDVFKNL